MDDIPSVGLRIFAGYGPGELHKNEIASVITLFTNEILAGRNPVIFGNGCQTRDFVYIDDIVEAAIRLIDSEYTGVLNVGSGEAHSFKDVVKRVNDFLGTDLSAKYIDRPNSYFEHTLADTRKMERILGFSPMSFEKSLEKYFEARLKNV